MAELGVMRAPGAMSGGPGVGAEGPGRARRRVSALLNTYYHIEGGKQEEAPTANAGEGGWGAASARGQRGSDDDLDRQGFDAKRYFDGMTASGQLPELVQRANTLDAEVKELDADMQMLVYENYSKFIRATDVIKQMRFTIEGLKPDLRTLDGSLKKISEHQAKVEEGVAERAGQIDGLLKQQRVCRKLQILFDLPRTLQTCLDRGAYGKAVEAYVNCAGFLRQYECSATFKKVLEEVDERMGRIRSALETRLRSPDLSVDEAVNSSVTLLDLREDPAKVAGEYLGGRRAMLQRSLDECFPQDTSLTVGRSDGARDALASSAGEALTKDQQELQLPESVALRTACKRAAETHVPMFCATVEGFSKLQGRLGSGDTSPSLLADFVKAHVEELCGRIEALIGRRCPPTRVLVSCVHCVRDALRRLHPLFPQLLSKLFMAFLSRVAHDAMRALFADASAGLVADLRLLHGECMRLQESKSSGLDEVLEEISRTEQSIIMHGFTALTDCTPLLSLLGSTRASAQELVRNLQSRLTALFLAFVEVSHAYIGRASRQSSPDPALPPLAPAARRVLEEISTLEWSGLFGLALVRIGRHLEVKAIGKVWSVAKDLFAASDAAAASELSTPPTVLIRETRGAAQAVITHYAVASGQRLAHFLRNSVQTRNWMIVREPREPRVVVEMVLREVNAFDAQLAKLLGDPRRARGQEARRILSQNKSAMELEMERLFAKKLPVYAPIPFNRNGAIVGILRIAYKGLYEYMREETFAKFGLQQIQVDCAFLSDLSREFVEAEDASVLDSLLGEAVASATARCTEPVLMEASVVEALCDEKKKTFKFD
eukprot:TRINITY_DN56512_c0_g1_i1.p1 TRINITY_DN56512_c0_g1~~TRINITY_DN56512_c0_g1_i1.p1  ORF type:complete len:832 (-),score=218.84 TRINITY_DN56512_c0_g1_i1:147-2642(-)